MLKIKTATIQVTGAFGAATAVIQKKCMVEKNPEGGFGFGMS